MDGYYHLGFEDNDIRLSQKEIQELVLLKEQGSKEARETLILSHLRLVASVARKHTRKGVPFEDLYQEGCYGLILAVDLYKYRPNMKFATFAWNYINKYVQKGVVHQSDHIPISLSEEYYYMLRRYQQVYFEMNCKLGRPPSDQELAEGLGLNKKYIKKLNCVLFRYISLNDDTPKDTKKYFGRPFIEIVSATQDTQRPTEDAAISSLIVNENLLNHTLTDMEREVIFRRIGMTATGTPETYPTIASDLGISEETARRAFARGINKVRIIIDGESPPEKKRKYP